MSRIYTTNTIVLCGMLSMLFAATTVFAQNPAPAKPQEKPVALIGATIHPVSGKPVPDGVIVFEKGIIKAVGGSDTPFDRQNTEIINVKGKHIYPGTIAPVTTVGLQEIASVRATLDFQETGGMNPNVRALIAYNTDSEVIPTLRSSGILIAQATPIGGLLSGTSSVFQTDGWNWEDAVLRKDDGVWVNWPPYVSRTFNQSDFSSALKRNEGRQKLIDQLDQFFLDAAGYRAENTPEPVNLRLQAMSGVLSGTANLYIRAQLAKDIVEAVRFAKRHQVANIVIVGGSEADKVSAFLAENKVPVILNELHRLPDHQDEEVYRPYELPGKLLNAGVKVAMSYADEWWRVRNLNYQAGTASGFSQNLQPEEALKLVTLYPAQILGIDRYVGSLEVGKHATMVVTRGDILDMKTNIVEDAFLKGARVNLDDKQKRLYEKYKEKYGQKD